MSRQEDVGGHTFFDQGPLCGSEFLWRAAVPGIEESRGLCGVVWCAEGAVTRRQWPGCLPTGTGKREGCVCCVRAVCK